MVSDQRILHIACASYGTAWHAHLLLCSYDGMMHGIFLRAKLSSLCAVLDNNDTGFRIMTRDPVEGQFAHVVIDIRCLDKLLIEFVPGMRPASSSRAGCPGLLSCTVVSLFTFPQISK